MTEKTTSAGSLIVPVAIVVIVAIVIFAGLFLTACASSPAPTRARPLLVPSLPPASSAGATAEAAPPAQERTPTQDLTGPRADAPTPTPPPVTAFPSPLSTPAPKLRRLTSGGCCPQPFWSPDGRQVRFIDRPPSLPVGIYEVAVNPPGPPRLLTERIVDRSDDGAFLMYPEGNRTIVERASTGERYAIPNGGRPVSVSPDGQRLLWQVREQSGNFDQRRGQIWVSNVDGSAPRVVAETLGFTQSRWIDGQRLLLVGLPLEDLPFVAIATLTLGTEEGQDRQDQLTQLAQVSRPRGTLLSPQGGWLIYMLAFQSNPSDDGLWIVPTDDSQPPRQLPFFGSYRWRDENRLLYVPLELGVESHALWEYDRVAGESRRLTDPAQTAFKIANNDWSVSPDGRRVVFLNAADHNLWVMTLPPPSPP